MLQGRLWKSSKMMLMLVLMWSLCINGVLPAHANASSGRLVFDFEDGTTQGWYGRGGKVTITSEATNGGRNVLHASERTANWQGPAYSLTSHMAEGVEYSFEAYVKLEAGAEDTAANMMINRISGGEPGYDVVAYGVTVSSDSWTKLSGTYTRPAGAEQVTLYFELPKSLGSFYIDNISLVSDQEEQSGYERIVSDFEDGTLQGWTGRGSTVVLGTSAVSANESTYGLEVKGRTTGWNGASLELSSFMEQGKTYRLSAWVRLPEGAAASTVSILIQRTTGGETFYERVAGSTARADRWVKVSGDYSLENPFESIAVYLEAFDAPTLDFYMDDVVVERIEGPPPVIPIVIQEDIPSLKDVFANYFRFGAALLVNEIEDADGPDAKLLKKHFNVLTAGNELKWDATEPREGQFNFTRSDKIVNFAVENGIEARGHTLIWHSQTPDWVFYDENNQLVSKEVLFARMKVHIETVMERYKGKIYAWDVVNEVLEPGHKQPNGLRNSLWYQIAGEEYIEEAFKLAHAADPDAKLYINDYNTHQPEKRQDLYNLIKRLQDKGIPIHGVGHQTHISIEGPSLTELNDMIAAFRDLGIEQEVTEMDMSVYTNDNQAYETFPEELSIKQAYRYQAIFDIFKQHSDQLKSVILWGKDDLNTWLRTFPVVRNNWPLLFDERMQAKYAYWALVDPGKVPLDPQTAFAANATINVDGLRDKSWSKTRQVVINDEENAAVSKLRTLWDANHLYVWADVYDRTVNENDAVHIYIDGNKGRTGEYEEDDAKYTFVRDAGGSQGAVPFNIIETEHGYSLEASIPIANGSVGKEIGFEVRIDNGTAQGLTHASWNDKYHKQDNDTSRFGVLRYVEAPRDTTALKGTPDIDGIIDSIWENTNEIETSRWVSGSSGATAKVKALWDDKYLYVLAQVTDPLLTKRSANVWEQDSIEIFVDQNNEKTESYQEDDGQYRINFDNEQSVSPASLSGNLNSAAVQTEEGYIIEAAISWNGAAPAIDDVIGFDVQVNDDQNDDGTRDSTAIWNDHTGESWRSTSGFGILTLTDTTTRISYTDEAFDSALRNARGGVLQLDAKVDNANDVAVEITAAQIRKAAAKGISSINLKTTMAELDIPFSAIGKTDKTIVVGIRTIGSGDWPAELSRKGVIRQMIDISIRAGDQELSSIGDKGVLLVRYPYLLQQKEIPGKIVVYAIGKDGRLEVIKQSHYEVGRQQAVFKTGQTGRFALVYAPVRITD